MTEIVQPITEHYQKTFEITNEYWKERNRLFVFLVIVSGIGLLLLLHVPEVSKLLVDAIAKLLGITDPPRISQLYKDFPLDILLSAFLIIVFYLIQKLSSTNLSVMRNYLYLGAIEGEIREKLGLPAESVSFTREGNFYWGRRSFVQKMTKWYYILVLLIVLLPFLFLKLQSDVDSGNIIMIIMDSLVAILILLFFVEYSRSSIKLDVPRVSNTNPN